MLFDFDSHQSVSFDRIDLENNHLSSVPDCIGSLINLATYGIQFCHEISILIAPFNRLYLDDNRLTSLPESIVQMTNLTEYGIQFVIRL